MKKVKRFRRYFAVILSVFMIASTMPVYAAEETTVTESQVSTRNSGTIEKQAHFYRTTQMTITVPASKKVHFTVWASNAPDNSINIVCNGSLIGTYFANGRDHQWSYSYATNGSRTYTLRFEPVSGGNNKISCYVRVDYS